MKQTRDGVTYVYRLMDSWKKENGEINKSRERKMIGRVIEGTGGLLMYPNKNYYEVYELQEPQVNYAKTTWPGRKSTVKKHPDGTEGPAFALACLLALSNTGIGPLLVKHLGKQKAEQLSLLACHYASGKTSSENIDVAASLFSSIWPEAEGLTSQAVSRLLEDIGGEQLRSFFADWIPQAAGEDILAYDVTAFTSKAVRMRTAEYGYTHGTVEHDPQVNFALFCNQRTGVPVFFTHYAGSLNDKTNLTHVVETAFARGLPHNVTMVMDRGMSSHKNLQYLQQAGVHFICGAPGTIGAVKRLLAEFYQTYNDMAEGGFTISCAPGSGAERELMNGATHRQEWDGVSLDVHLYRSERRAVAERLSLMYGIELCQEHLRKYGSLPDDGQQARAVSCFELQGQGRGRHWELNKEKVKTLSNMAGCFALFSSPEMNLTAKEALELYRRREVDEECFDCLKNDMGGLPLRIHSDSRLDGKFFVLFLALCIKKYLIKQAAPVLKKLNRSYSFLVTVLENYRCELRERTVPSEDGSGTGPVITEYLASMDAFTKTASSLLSCIAGNEIAEELNLRDTISPKKGEKQRKTKGKTTTKRKSSVRL